MSVPALKEVGLDQNPVAVFLGSRLASHSRKTMLGGLKRANMILSGGQIDVLNMPWNKLRVQHMKRLRTMLIESGMAPATVNITLSSVRGVLREAWELRQISTDDYQRAISVKDVPNNPLPTGRHVESFEIEAMMDTCHNRGATGLRDAAIILLCYNAGLRRNEAVQVRVEDYSGVTGDIAIRHGKGNRARIVNIGGINSRVWMRAWIAARGEWEGPLLAPITKTGSIQKRGMTSQSIRNRLSAVAEIAKVEPLTPHDLRRSFIGELLNAGEDIVTAQKLAGHASVSTTAKYDRRGDEVRRRAAGKIQVPAYA